MLTGIPSFKAAKVLVIGDIMLDRYWYGAANRISPEAPVPVVAMHHGKVHHSLGGAANVAANLAALGAEVTLLGIVGNDEPAQKLEHMLNEQKIHYHFEKLNSHPTITKLRIVSHHQQLMRLDFEEFYDEHALQALLPTYKEKLAHADVVILSDYGKGTLFHPELFIKAAQEAKVPVLIDPKRNDFTVYEGATLITPNQKEFEAVVGACKTEQELVTKGLALMDKHTLGSLLITRGEHGMLLLQRDKPPFSLKAHAREVFDVTGAGDTVVAMLAAAVAVHLPLEEAITLANVAASIAISKLGTATVTPDELAQTLPKIAGRFPIYSEAEVVERCKAARARGKKIVMTNGCFDVIHASHVTYLNRAKQLGDYLIVAINSDESVQRLKGPHRPIHELEARLQVLASLSAVDFVLPFDEDTPERLIELIRPDVLVKGGDYTVEGVVGGDIVKAYGGEVVIAPSDFGYSTTRILEKLKNESSDR
ncbi:MAG: bifunctional D-glycero-beta-D-manno-heptose-7-phosphate kinase/D-glycero-beta-D-manno-heptose 1-phosphate adenylyltransferase HldE [Legionellales bacterium]|jgi:D-beta-D-heptose 7-phosphate kinase/D-beta-D-heptose 1-phosphate adenosyltransferase